MTPLSYGGCTAGRRMPVEGSGGQYDETTRRVREVQ